MGDKSCRFPPCPRRARYSPCAQRGQEATVAATATAGAWCPTRSTTAADRCAWAGWRAQRPAHGPGLQAVAKPRGTMAGPPWSEFCGCAHSTLRGPDDKDPALQALVHSEEAGWSGAAWGGAAEEEAEAGEGLRACSCRLCPAVEPALSLESRADAVPTVCGPKPHRLARNFGAVSFP